MDMAQPKHAKFSKHDVVGELPSAARLHLAAPSKEVVDLAETQLSAVR
jgi:hypothetical protein